MLVNEKCIPCKGKIDPLSISESQLLLKELDDWELVDQKLEKSFTLNNFKGALDFASDVGHVAEQEDHHPNIEIKNYKNVKIVIWTHSINGLHKNDFILAAKIDSIKASKKIFSSSFELI